MNDPSPTRCEVCAASPLERVMHPVAVHYKGSGFYSTDYGKGGAGKGAAKDAGAGKDSGGGEASSGGSSGESSSGAASSESSSSKPAES